jgi:Ca-activated chloride channel family protein
MKRKFSILGLFALLLFCWVGAEAQKQKEDKQKDETQPMRVKLRAAVVDDKSRLVENLGKEHLSVFENGAKQTIESVRYDPGPLSLGIVADTSGSMRPHLGLIRSIIKNLIKLSGSEDEIFLAQFKAEPELVQDFTRNKSEIENALGELYTSGGTGLFDAVIATADYARKQGKNRHKALVFITDVMEKNSATDFKKAAKALEENEVELYILTLPYLAEDRSTQFKKVKKNEDIMIRLADHSGGEAFFPETLATLEAALIKVVKAMQSPYVISYSSTEQTRDGNFRNVRVQAQVKDDSKLTTYSREGYFAVK